MAFEVVWSAKARVSHLRNLEYLEREWSHDSAVQFARRIDTLIELLRQNPRMGKREERFEQEIRWLLPTNQTKLFYQIVGETIIVLNMFNTKQHPGKELE